MFEPLERRELLATLGLGIHLRADDDGQPGGDPVPGPAGLRTFVDVGEVFWIEVLVEDQRNPGETAAGVISLPLNLSWDSDNIELLNPPTQFTPDQIALNDPLLTMSFPLQRFVDAYNPNDGHRPFDEMQIPPPSITVPTTPNIDGLRGAALPNAGFGQAIGITPNFVFSRLQFRANGPAVNDTPITMQVDGSMSFADAAQLDAVATLSAGVIQDRTPNNPPRSPVVTGPTGPQLAVTEFIDIGTTGTQSLSGFVYADTDLDGMLDTDANGVPTEIGLPNVTVSLTGGATPLQTTTGPDGWYHFDNLAAGTYQITEMQPDPDRFVNAPPNPVGQIVVSGAVRPGTGNAVGSDQFTNVTLAAGEHGVDYNFGENLIPTKRNFLTSMTPRQAFCENLDVTCRTVRGTDANNNIVAENLGGTIRVTVDSGAPQDFPVSQVDIVYIDAQAGNDTVELRGTAANEVANLLPGAGSLRQGDDFDNTNYGMFAFNAEEVIANVGTGDDLAVMRDSPGDDELMAPSRTSAELTRTGGLVSEARGFDTMNDRIRAISLAGTDDENVNESLIDYVLEQLGTWI